MNSLKIKNKKVKQKPQTAKKYLYTNIKYQNMSKRNKRDKLVWPAIIAIVIVIIVISLTIATNYDIFKDGLNGFLSLCNQSHTQFK
jgi:hypothetical protein